MLTSISTVDDLNYPEKTETYYVVNVPYIFSACWKVVKPLLQERTKKKVKVLSGCGRDELLKVHSWKMFFPPVGCFFPLTSFVSGCNNSRLCDHENGEPYMKCRRTFLAFSPLGKQSQCFTFVDNGLFITPPFLPPGGLWIIKALFTRR